MMTKLRNVGPLPNLECADPELQLIEPSARICDDGDAVYLDIPPVQALEVEQIRKLRDWLTSVLPDEPPAPQCKCTVACCVEEHGETYEGECRLAVNRRASRKNIGVIMNAITS